MYILSVIGLSISLVSISIITQRAEAQNCSYTNVESCRLAYNSEKTQAAQDKNKICSAVNIYLECLNKVSTDCGVDASQTITEARKDLSQFSCVSKPFSLARKSKRKKKKKSGDDDDSDYDFSGAGSIFLNLGVIGLGLTFYTLV
ncbi:uncharacterized protein LOC127705827 [Mytilus californianus]|uniref:uncharacterized protein LOC127705827 n=1 Tax=Mytilus californianus TaxID=6549 RepID=UPI0022484514|nr:uncharacterized protein LOC127705827 [Mytilus californianus]